MTSGQWRRGCTIRCECPGWQLAAAGSAACAGAYPAGAAGNGQHWPGLSALGWSALDCVTAGIECACCTFTRPVYSADQLKCVLAGPFAMGEGLGIYGCRSVVPGLTSAPHPILVSRAMCTLQTIVLGMPRADHILPKSLQHVYGIIKH